MGFRVTQPVKTISSVVTFAETIVIDLSTSGNLYELSLEIVFLRLK